MISVLIVEDDPMVAELNRRYLEKVPGFQLAAMARSVDEALETITKRQIHLILLDIFMPGLNGLDLLDTIRSENKDIDVIVVSAAGDKLSIKHALRHGAVDYLIKPFEFERFQEALNRYRSQILLMRNCDIINQEELDRKVLGKEQQEQRELAKGLDRNTLKKVWEDIQTLEGKLFTTEEIAVRAGLSRVSMRKYLEFLKQIDVLSMEVVYGTVGRPVYQYRLNQQDSWVIKRYL